MKTDAYCSVSGKPCPIASECAAAMKKVDARLAKLEGLVTAYMAVSIALIGLLGVTMI